MGIHPNVEIMPGIHLFVGLKPCAILCRPFRTQQLRTFHILRYVPG